MSDHEEVPELDPEAKAFLTRHQRTGEPSAEALERARQRLSAPAPSAAPAPVVRLAPRRRPLVPPEVMAAAAVVLLLLGAQALYLVLREPAVSEQPDPGVKAAIASAERKAIAEAWRAGEFEKASRLASQDCRSAGCGRLASDLAKMIGLAQHVETLTDAERDQLAAFDQKLSGGRDSAIKRKLDSRQVTPVAEEAPPPQKPALAELLPGANVELAKQLYSEAADLKRAKNFEAAIIRLAKCIKLEPNHHPCYRLMGSAYAALASRDQSAADMEHAKEYYERFLEVAPPDDENVPKVRAILEAVKDPEPSSAEDEAGPGDLKLAVGGSMTITLNRNIARVALGDPSVADVSVAGPKALRVEGLKPGKTTILAWYADGGRASMGVIVSPSNNLDDRMDQLFVDASMARTQNDYATAFKHLRTLQQLDPNHPGAQRMLLEMKQAARELYLRGYQIKETSPRDAVRLFKQVMSMTLPSDELHQKAQSRVRDFEAR